MILNDFTESGYEFVNYTHCNLDLHTEILHLRNSSHIRQWMIDQNIIHLEDHLSFIEKLKSNDDRFYFVVLFEERIVASINISKETDCIWERGIFVSPSFAGSGHTAAIEVIFNRHLMRLGITALTAKVKNDNLRSLKYHEKFGYRTQKQDEEFTYFILDLK